MKFIQRMVSVILTTTLLLAVTVVGISPVHAKQAPIVVSMGDSYASGEGTDIFYGSPAASKDSKEFCDWIAHRSPKVWSGQLVFNSLTGSLADHKDENWYLVACSGAVTDDVIGKKGKNNNLIGQTKKFSRDDSGKGEITLDPQIEIFNKMNGEKADYITLSIGGNDMGFVYVLITAAISGPSYQHVNLFHSCIEILLTRIPNIKAKLKNVYKTISERAGNQSTILVTGYPQLIDNIKCIGSLVNPNEAIIINSATSYFNNAIEETVNDCKNSGIKIEYIDIESEFKGHGAYSGEGKNGAWINGFDFKKTQNNINTKNVIKNKISDCSFHPNEYGQAAYARCVQAKINEIEGDTQTPKPTESESKTQPQTTFDDSNPITLLGLPLNSILEKYGDNYTTVDEPGSGLTKYICYPNTGNPYEFGIDYQTNCVKAIYVYDINNAAVPLFDDVTNRTKLSEMAAARNKYPCEVKDNIQIDNCKQSVSFAYDKRIMVSFEWTYNDTADKANRVLILKTDEDIQFAEKSQSQSNDSQKVSPKGNLDEWKQLYLDFLRSDEAKYFTSASLVYLNDDNIPELALHTAFMLNGTQICWISNGKTEYQAIGALGTFRNRPNQGIIAVSSLNRGIQGISIDQFDGETINRIHFGEITDTGVYRWDNVEITESEYNSKIAEYSDLSEPSFVSKEDMILSLQN